jgi:hypothetical protein
MLICNAPRSVTAAPAWVKPGAYLDLDFANGRYWGGYVSAQYTVGGLMSLQNGGANAAYTAPTTDGKVYVFALASMFRIIPGYGLWVEGNGQNKALQSRDLTQAVWVASNCTVSRNQPGADTDATANTGSLITATSGNGTVLQSITLASSTVITSAYVKRSVGTGTVEMTQDGGGTWTAITGSINSSTYARVNVAAATVTNPQVGFRLGTSGDAIVVDFFQTEQGSYVTSPIITTSAARSRGSEMPMFGTVASNFDDGLRFIQNTHFSGRPLSQYVEFAANFDGVTVANVKGGGNFPTGRIQIQAGGNAEIRTGAGPATATANTVNNGIANVNKVATRQNGAGEAICLNGGAIATGTTNKIDLTDATDNHMGFGNRGAGDQPLNGYVKRYVAWDREITDGQMLEYTR